MSFTPKPDSEPTSDDKSLLHRYRRGDDDAATELYLRYAHRLRALANAQTSPELQQRVDNEDLVQSIFRTFFRRVAGGQYDVPNGDELWKLLLVIGLEQNSFYCDSSSREQARRQENRVRRSARLQREWF